MTLIGEQPAVTGRDLAATVLDDPSRRVAAGGEIGEVYLAGTTRLGVRVRRGLDGRLDLLADVQEAQATSAALRSALAAHPLVAQVVVLHRAGRAMAVVVPRKHPAGYPARSPRVDELLGRIGRLAPERVLQIGIGDVELPAALSAQCAGYRLVDPSVPRVCDVLARRPDLRLRSQVRAMPAAIDALASAELNDLVLIDLAAPSLSTLDIPAAAGAALRLVHRAGAVVVANLRDPRLERLASWIHTGTPLSTPDAAGWSPPAVLRALAAALVDAHAYPPLRLAGEFDVVLRNATGRTRVPVLRWHRDLHSPAQLARLLGQRTVERVRLVGIPLAGVVNGVAAWRASAEPRSGTIRYGLGIGVDWRVVEAIGAEHGYLVTFSASLTGAEYHFDAIVERQAAAQRPPGPAAERLTVRLRRWLGLRSPGMAGPVDLVVLDAA
jgi:hypothetical protein